MELDDERDFRARQRPGWNVELVRPPATVMLERDLVGAYERLGGFRTGACHSRKLAPKSHPGDLGYSGAIVPATRFPIRIGRRSRFVLYLYGVRASNAFVELGDEFRVSFGLFHVRTPMANLASWRIEGPWLWITAIGVRLSLRHHDLTFAGTGGSGVRVDFKEPVRTKIVRLPAVYVTLEDLDRFVAALTALGVSGQDARKPSTR